jgi:hypothetical protein
MLEDSEGNLGSSKEKYEIHLSLPDDLKLKSK